MRVAPPDTASGRTRRRARRPRGIAALAAGRASLYLFAATAVIGCERAPAPAGASRPPAGGTLVSVVGPPSHHPQSAGVLGGAARYFRDAAAVRGTCVAPPDDRPETLVQTVRELLDQRPAAVCLWVSEAAAAQEVLDLLAARQVVIITMGAPLDDPRVSGHVGVALAAAAEMLGAALPAIARGGRTYLLLHERGRDDLATATYLRFITTARRHYEMRLLEERSAAESPGGGPELIEALLDRFPRAGLVVTLNPDVWLVARAGWERRLRELNRDFRFATLSAAPVLWARLGTAEAPGDAAALVGPLDGEIGYAAVELAVGRLFSAPAGPVERSVACELVTAESLADFARRYAEAAGGLDVAACLPAATGAAGE